MESMDRHPNAARAGMFQSLWIIGLLLLSCEAERDNPYDPKSPLYRDEGALVGWVKTRTGKPIPGVVVEISPHNKFSVTDLDGRYEMKCLKSGESRVFASLKGYSRDSGEVTIKILKTDTLNFVLDCLPQFEHCLVRTYNIINKNNQAEFETAVADGDGVVDIDSVSCWVEDILDTFRLEYDDGVYKKTIQAKTLPGNTLESLAGKDVFFIAYDKAGASSVSSPCAITRIIDEIPTLVEPVNFQIADKNPTLVWNKTLTSFPYSCRVEVMSTQLGVIWSRDGISSNDTTVTVDENLEADDYSWVVWIVDEYGNHSRSITAGFKVK